MNWKRLLVFSAGIVGAYILWNRVSKLSPRRRPLPMLVSLKLPFSKVLVFRGFLPETKAGGLHLRFNGWQAGWLDAGGKWRRLLVGKDEDFGSTSLAGENDYVDQGRWREVASFIEEGKQAPMTTVLIANSLLHLSQDNDRLAVVEAVTAVEAYINTYLHKLLLRLPKAGRKLTEQIRKEQGLPEASAIEERHVKKLLEGKGLRGTVDEIFTILTAEVGLSADDVRDVREAINERNLVLHGSKREVGIAKAKRYVSAIDRVLMTFRQVTLAME